MPIRPVVFPCHAIFELLLQMTTQKVWRTTDNLERRSATGFLAAEIRSNRAANGVTKPSKWVISAALTELVVNLCLVSVAILFVPASGSLSIGRTVFVRVFL